MLSSKLLTVHVCYREPRPSSLERERQAWIAGPLLGHLFCSLRNSNSAVSVLALFCVLMNIEFVHSASLVEVPPCALLGPSPVDREPTTSPVLMDLSE